MTRLLSELLGVNRLELKAGLAQLERASGHNNRDITLSSEMTRAAKIKLKELGLDPNDTTGPELYHALQERFKADDARLMQCLRDKYADAGSDDIDRLVSELSGLPIHKSTFSLKNSVAKRLLKKYPPKQAMKALGYRSLDSFLKHESLGSVYAACNLCESRTWHKRLTDQYKKLTATDFEIRPLAITYTNSPKWHDLAGKHVSQRRHNVLEFKEIGAIVLLPLPADQPPAAATTSLLLALKSMNELRAASTYLKLCQVKPNFGHLVQQVAAGEATLQGAELFGRAVPWQVVQRYYGRFVERYRPELFEPHVQVDDLSWHSIEKVLSYIDPRLEFWHHTTHLSLSHSGQPVSFNIIDVALSHCNRLPFEARVNHYFRRSLWHELVIRYLHHDNVEQLVLGGLENDLVSSTE